MNSKYLIDTAVREYPDNVAVVRADVRLTFKQLDDRVNRLANALLDLGVHKGDRVGILLKNCVEFIETDFALSKTGLVRVALNYRLGIKDHRIYHKRFRFERAAYSVKNSPPMSQQMKGNLPTIEKFICVGK